MKSQEYGISHKKNKSGGSIEKKKKKRREKKKRRSIFKNKISLTVVDL